MPSFKKLFIFYFFIYFLLFDGIKYFESNIKIICIFAKKQELFFFFNCGNNPLTAHLNFLKHELFNNYLVNFFYISTQSPFFWFKLFLTKFIYFPQKKFITKDP